MTAADTEKSNFIEEVDLSAPIMTRPDGQSANYKMTQVVQLLSDPSSSCRLQQSVCSDVMLWQANAPNEVVEETMLVHSDSILNYILRILREGSDAEYGSPDIQISAYSLTSCVQKQMKNSSSSSFISKMVPAILSIIGSLASSKIYLKEKLPNTADSNVSSRTEVVRLLIKCIPTESNYFISETISMYFSFMKLISATATPGLRGEILGSLVAIGRRDKSLFNPHVYDLVGAMRFGEADELLFILKDNYRVFNELAPKVLEHNVHYLVTLFGFSSLSEALLSIAMTDSGASKLSSSVTSITKDMEGIQAAGALLPLIMLLLRFAIVKPESVSRHLSACIYAYKCTIAQDAISNHSELGQEEILGAERTDFVSSNSDLDGPPATSVLLVNLLKLFAAASRAGIEETYASLGHLTTILQCGTVRTFTEKNALIGALDVAKNECPQGDIFSEDTLAALCSISHANRVSYANIMKWNKGKRAPKGDLRVYLEHVDHMLCNEVSNSDERETVNLTTSGTSAGGGCFVALSTFFCFTWKKQHTSTVSPYNGNISDVEARVVREEGLKDDAENTAGTQSYSRLVFSPKVAPFVLLSASITPVTPVVADSLIETTPMRL